MANNTLQTGLLNSDLIEGLIGDQGLVDTLLGTVISTVDGVVNADLDDLNQPTDDTTTNVQQLLSGIQTLPAATVSLLSSNGTVDQITSETLESVSILTGNLLTPIDLTDAAPKINDVTDNISNIIIGEETLPGALNSLLGMQGSVDQTVDAVTDGLNDSLGLDLNSLDPMVDQLTTEVVGLVSQVPVLTEGLIADNGAVDALAGNLISTVDGLVNADLDDLNQPLDDTTTAVQQLLNGEMTLPQVTTSLLGSNGTVDQIANEALESVSILTGNLLTEIDLTDIAPKVNEVTTDINDILTGEQSLTDSLDSLLGEEGSIDQTVDALTDGLNDSLGLNLNGLDSTVDGLTTLVSGLLTGTGDFSGLDGLTDII